MIKIKVKIKGLDELVKGTKKLTPRAAREISKAVQKSVKTIHNRAIKEAPVNKGFGGGTLRQNIRSRMTSKFGGVIESNASYSAYVHEGTKPHIIRPVMKKVLADRRTNRIFGKKVMHPGTKKNPFMERAVLRSVKKMEEFFDQALRNILKVL